MKVLIVSDTHGYLSHMFRAVQQCSPTHVIHLGDHAGDALELERKFPMLPVISVRGNCDYYDTTPEQRLVNYDGVRILMCHGHRYGVKNGLLRYEMAARENEVDVALFGHTHCAYNEEYNGLWLVNPGSCGYCAVPTCAVLQIKAGTVSCRIVRLDEME